MRTRRILSLALIAATTIALNAQQVTTLYFLENAPMRHTINPAFQPVSQGYLNFTPLGWTTINSGNNSLTMSDIFLTYTDPSTGAKKTITPLHPYADKTQFMNTLRDMTLVSVDATLGLLNFGFRHKDNGFVTIGINERIETGTALPKSMFQFMMAGSSAGIGALDLTGLGVNATIYTEFAGGYSYKLNDQWTVGGKVKFLIGEGYVGFKNKSLAVEPSLDQWHIYGESVVDVAAPLNLQQLKVIEGMSVLEVAEAIQQGQIALDSLLSDGTTGDIMGIVRNVVKPSGYGAAFDLGFTYKPIDALQISAAITDLGFIYWTRNNRFSSHVDTVYNGLGDIELGAGDQSLGDSIVENLKGLADGFVLHHSGFGAAHMTSARLNVGLDVNFWDNRIGLGIVSATRLFNARLYEEVTLGFSFRPVNWFNIAASYSLLNNGKYSNIGAGLSFMPYDGINLTLAMDYIPTSYAAMPNTQKYVLPAKAKTVNFAFGLSFCWGTNKKDKDKDGVWDKLDMCPETPRGVAVDSVGCPLDEDHDGVPDYLDHCLGTPAASIGFVDEHGCSLDTDGDGVPDYLDKCPNTPEEARDYIDSLGCPLDTDGDGVPDYLDQCPGTPAEARGMIDATGCPLDSDGDGVPDYLDKCPNTPAEAKVDADGCPLDTDHDGVPDYKDECPNTPKKAIGFVDEKGCEKDSDGDGVPDYEDECPFVIGVKANKGCPEVKREVRQLLQKAMQGIEFETGKATIKAKSHDILNLIATIFIDNPSYIVEIQGHTDNTGKAEQNKKISQQRAEAVMAYLVKKGVPAERLTAVGYGPDVPIADNKTKAGRQKNRRVEFKISFEEVHYETVLDHADPTPAPAAE